MYSEENKKVLFIVGLGQEFDYDYVKRKYLIPQEELIILESDELANIQPFGDLMRDLIIQVYQKNIEEIVIVPPKEGRKSLEDIFDKIESKLDVQNNIRTLDYLFAYSNPGYPSKTIKEWLEGNNRLEVDVQKTIEAIRCHPLMPPTVKVTALEEMKESVRS